jgi:hypothetical protein
MAGLPLPTATRGPEHVPMVVPVDRSGVPRDQPEAAKANAAIAEWQYDPKNVLSLEYACPAGGGCPSTALTVSAKIADMQVRGYATFWDHGSMGLTFPARPHDILPRRRGAARPVNQAGHMRVACDYLQGFSGPDWRFSRQPRVG